MNLPASLAMPLRGHTESLPRRPRSQQKRPLSGSLPVRASLLFFVSAAHLAALWALSQAPVAVDIQRSAPLAVIMVEIAKASSAPDPAPPVQTLPPTQRQLVSRAIRPRPAQAPVVRAAKPLEEAPRTRSDAPTANAAEQSTPISQQESAAPSHIEAPAPQASPAPAAAAPAAPIRPRFDAAYLNNPAPAYPALARRLGEEGTVRIRVWVTREGRAGKVELSQSAGSPRLDRTALETVSRWRFEPARENDEPVDQWVIVPVKFKLENQ